MKLIILDRDGVINYNSPDYIKAPAEWQAIPGSLAAIARLTQAGYTIAVATNQSGIGRGLYDVTTLNAIHEKMHLAVAKAGGKINIVAYCPHRPDENCPCRKPKPGLLIQIGEAFNCALDNIPLVGDKVSDLQAAQVVNAKPYWVAENLPGDTIKQNAFQVPMVANLSAAVDAILLNEGSYGVR